MSSKKRPLSYWISAWLPVALGICVILVESTEYFGSDRTSKPLRFIYEALFGHVSNRSWDRIHHVIRKLGHFFGYGFVGVAWLRAWWMTLPNSRFMKDCLLALAGTAVIASWDEYHQTHLRNRTGSVQDVLLDCAGATALLIIIYMILRTTRPGKLSHQG